MLEIDMVLIFITFNGYWDANLGYVSGEQMSVMVLVNTSYVCLGENLTNDMRLIGQKKSLILKFLQEVGVHL